MKPTAKRVWGLGLGVALLAGGVGCGGGGALESKDNPEALSSISAATVSYSRTMTVTVNGGGLTDGLKMAVAEGCEDIKLADGGTAFARQFTCKVTKLGSMLVVIEGAAGKRLGTLTLDVPLPEVSLITPKGTITLELDPVKAPKSVNNFLAYVNEGFYRNVVFHRVDPVAGVIQAGGFKTGTKLTPVTGAKDSIALESKNGLSNLRYSVGMARMSSADSATSEFYVNLRDNPDFDYKSDDLPGYAVFGRVLKGMDVVDTIGGVETAPRTWELNGATYQLDFAPKQDVIIQLALQSK